MIEGMKKRLKKDLTQTAVTNGWVSPLNNRVLPQVYGWWKANQHLPYSKLRRACQTCRFTEENPNSPDALNDLAEEKSEEIVGVFRRYHGVEVSEPSERQAILSNITKELLEVSGNPVLVRNLMLRYRSK